MTQQLQSPFIFHGTQMYAPHRKIQTAKTDLSVSDAVSTYGTKTQRKTKKKESGYILQKGLTPLSDEHIFGKWLAREFKTWESLAFRQIDLKRSRTTYPEQFTHNRKKAKPKVAITPIFAKK